MELITLLIDQRASHVVNFESELRTMGLVDTYIINQREKTELMAFYTGNAQALPKGPDAEDEEDFTKGKKNKKDDDPKVVSIIRQASSGETQAYIKHIDYYEDAITKKASITIGLSTTVVSMDPLPTELSAHQDKEKGLYCLIRKSKPNETVTIDVTLRLDNGANPEWHDEMLKLCVAPAEKISDVVLDFGSEASQMAIFDHNPMDIDGIQPIFTGMQSLLTAMPATQKDPYVQQIKGDNNLFKSVFYVKTTVNASEKPVPELDSSGKIADLPSLKMITTVTEAQTLTKSDFILMPNVKLSGFGGIREPRVGGKAISKFRDGFFYRATINRFLMSALLKATESDEVPRCVRIYVLMPNVYTHTDVQKRLKWLKEDLAEMFDLNATLKSKVVCTEVIAVSESDASLLGAIDQLTHPDVPTPLEEGTYLILDGGKGTLDFSIIDFRNNEVTSRFRSGIIGAGNAMSYAYMLALLREFLLANTIQKDCRDEELQEWIFKKILLGDKGLTPDGAKLRELMEAVDSYKITMGEGEKDFSITPVVGISSTTRATQTFDKLTFDAFISFVKNMVNSNRYLPLSPAANRYIESMIGQIAADVSYSLSIAKAKEFQGIKGVFFAGRAFYDKELKSAILNRLNQDGIANRELPYLDPAHAAFNQKNICLYIRSHLQRGVTSNRMLSTPFAKVRKMQNTPGIDDAEPRGCLGSIGKWFSKLFSAKGAKKAVDNIIGGAYEVEQDINYDFVAATAKVNGMVFGYDLKINNPQHDWILIGGTYYHPTDSGSLKLFYADDKIYVRTNKGNNEEEITKELGGNDYINMKYSSLIFATLFPHVELHPDEISKVFIPKPSKISWNPIGATNVTGGPIGTPLGTPLNMNTTNK